MSGLTAMVYGAIAYGTFFVTFLYAIGFVGNLLVPKSVDSGTTASLLEALLVNTALLGVFALQHSVMARPAFKRWWKKFVPASTERSTYVLLASLALILLFLQWRPISIPVWTITNPVGVSLMWAIFALGWATVLMSTFLISHFELFGLAQVHARLRRSELPKPVFKAPFLYKRVRHPIYLGFLMAFWAIPEMTVGHLLFAAGTTGYILVGIWLEERDLVTLFGDQYRRYRQEVRMLVPLRRNQSGIDSGSASEPR